MTLWRGELSTEKMIFRGMLTSTSSSSMSAVATMQRPRPGRVVRAHLGEMAAEGIEVNQLRKVAEAGSVILVR